MCHGFYDHVCSKSDAEDMFTKATKANTKVIENILADKTWTRAILLDKTCEDIDGLEKFIKILGRYLAKHVSLESVSEYASGNNKKKCELVITLKGRYSKVRLSFARISRSIKLALTPDYYRRYSALLSILNNNNPKTKIEKQHWIDAFLRYNYVIEIIGSEALDKSKGLYQQCIDLDKEDTNGIKMFSRKITRLLDGVETEDKKESLTLLSAKLADLNLRGINPFFYFSVLDLLKTSIHGQENIGVLVQSHFIGDYDEDLRVNDCNLSADDIEFEDDLEFDSESEEDIRSMERFKELAKLAKKTVRDSVLEKVITFEKKFYKYSIGKSHLSQRSYLEKNSEVMDLSDISVKLKHVADWDKYFKELLKHSKPAHVMIPKFLVTCGSYFNALDKVLKTTDIGTILQYIHLSSIYFLNKQHPLMISHESATILGINNMKTCVDLVESSYPHVIAREIWETSDMKKKSSTINPLITELVNAFKTMIDENDWMSESDKEKGKKKADKMKRIVGVWPKDLNNTHLDGMYNYAKVWKTFTGTYMSIKRNNNIMLMKSLFDSSYNGLIVRSLPNEANASYDIRDNLLTINAGIFKPPFAGKHMTETEIFAMFGFVAAHEIMHSVGHTGIHVDENGEYSKTTDSNVAYRKMEESLSTRAKNICREHIDGKTVELNFNHVKEEIIADVGGFKLVMEAFKSHVGEERYENEAPELVKAMSKMFCGKLRKSHMAKKVREGNHPSSECRLKIISATKTFADIFSCRTNDQTVDVW